MPLCKPFEENNAGVFLRLRRFCDSHSCTLLDSAGRRLVKVWKRQHKMFNGVGAAIYGGHFRGKVHRTRGGAHQCDNFAELYIVAAVLAYMAEVAFHVRHIETFPYFAH